jgi:hypothetical protein
MAEETFTEADEKTLSELLTKRDRIRAAREEADRAAQAESFRVVEPIFDAIDWDKLRPALDAAVAAPGLSNDNRQRLLRLQQILTYDFANGLVSERDRLATPAPPAAADKQE